MNNKQLIQDIKVIQAYARNIIKTTNDIILDLADDQSLNILVRKIERSKVKDKLKKAMLINIHRVYDKGIKGEKSFEEHIKELKEHLKRVLY